MIGEGVSFGRWSIPESELEERFETSGGPGGQHANRSETAVVLRVDFSTTSLPEDLVARLSARLGPVLEVVASDTRSQWRNREIARQRLIERLEQALVEPKTRRKTKPSREAREKRLSQKKARAELKRTRRRPERD